MKKFAAVAVFSVLVGLTCSTLAMAETKVETRKHLTDSGKTTTVTKTDKKGDKTVTKVDAKTKKHMTNKGKTMSMNKTVTKTDKAGNKTETKTEKTMDTKK